MFEKILVVCVGNICRSPTGERLFRERLPGRQVSSAGVSALVDKPADKVASEVAQQHGLDFVFLTDWSEFFGWEDYFKPYSIIVEQNLKKTEEYLSILGVS